MTVFVIQEPRTPRDLSSAADYGEIRYLLDSKDDPSNLPGPCLRKVVEGLKDFDPNADYLTFAGGDPAGPMLVGFVLANRGLDSINYLRWDRLRDRGGNRSGRGVYIPVRFPIHTRQEKQRGF